MARLLERVVRQGYATADHLISCRNWPRKSRDEVISVVSEVGPHLASTLGAVEATLALHYVFNTPEDRIVWDTGHQAYAHKLICGRRIGLDDPSAERAERFFEPRRKRIRCFWRGHAGTSISAALGIVAATTLAGSTRKVVAVISDGGLSARLTFEKRA